MTNAKQFKGPGVRIYGASDDLVEMDGDISGEESADDKGNTVIMSDGSVLEINYGSAGIWRITLLSNGPLFDRLDVCPQEDEEHGYSDQAFFKPGITWAVCGRRMR